MANAYFIEVMRQRDFAMHATKRYIAVRKRFQQGRFVHEAHVEMYASAQSLLTAAAQISKLLWVVMPKENPPNSGLSDEQYAARRAFSLARAKALRKALDVSDDSLFKNRQVRNAVEHFDDRLDARMFEGATLLWDSNISSIGDFDARQRESTLRHLDPFTNRISVLDRAICLKELWEAVAAIGTAAAARYDEAQEG